jgi:hypothetical protein
VSDLRAEILAWLEDQEKLCEAATRGEWWIAMSSPGEGTVLVAGPDGDAVAECYGNIGLDEGYEAEAVAAFVSGGRTVLPLVLSALKGELEAHDGGQYAVCQECGEACLPDTACTAINRIHKALGLS